jgi:UDP-galactose transporter B1
MSPALALFQSEEGVFSQIFSMSGSSVLGNLFIYNTISMLGPVNLSLITTTRKIFSIFFSIVINGHVLDHYKVIGIGLVVLGILLEMIFKFRSGKAKEKAKTDKKVKAE